MASVKIMAHSRRLSVHGCWLFYFNLFSGGYLIILANAKGLGASRMEYENTMKRNQEKGLLNWIKLEHFQNYHGEDPGILYVFQKPE